LGGGGGIVCFILGVYYRLSGYIAVSIFVGGVGESGRIGLIG